MEELSKDLPYDDSSVEDILRYSEELIGKTFADVLANVFTDNLLKEHIEKYNNPKNKGTLGNLLEKYYYLYEPNSISDADFSKAGVELKVTPYEESKGKMKAGERLVITMIPNNEAILSEFIGSHLEKKIQKILMVWYNRIRDMPRTSYNIDFVNLYDIYSELCKNDLAVIIEDYKIIANKVISGKAHELSESDTRYLGACTKGATSTKSLRPQYYNKDIPAKRRAFSFKNSYMTYILNNYVKSGAMSFDSIFKKGELDSQNFDEKILSKINQNIGKSEEDLYLELGVNEKSKNANRTLVNRILGVTTYNSEEFEKANIVIKTIRVKKNGTPRESMSFPKITIKDFIKQDFDYSEEYKFFEETRFLFVVFKEQENGKYCLIGSKFWNMPITELESVGKEEWEKIRDIFISGVKFDVVTNRSGQQIIKNSLPKKSETSIFHLRPHSSKSAYIIDGVRYGNGSDSDMDELPNGDRMTHQCFWLNSNYVAKIIEDI